MLLLLCISPVAHDGQPHARTSWPLPAVYPVSCSEHPDTPSGPRSRCCCVPRPIIRTTEHTFVPRSCNQVSPFFSSQGNKFQRRGIPTKSMPSSFALLLCTLANQTLGPRSRFCCGPRIGRDTRREIKLERQLRDKNSPAHLWKLPPGRTKRNMKRQEVLEKTDARQKDKRAQQNSSDERLNLSVISDRLFMCHLEP